ncbi:MAG: zinc metallopeptidase [Chloroflexi bacterium]|nr:zinc metallopeptidase [Chloroflexota bacterium]
MFYGWNPMYWVFALPALLLALLAQALVQSSYRRYLRVANSSGMTGLEVARRIMRTTGLDLVIEGARGQLTDHYDPRGKVLRLSQEVATHASVASAAIVAHELGHAQQDAQGYLPLRVRTGLVPVVNFTSWLGPILFLIGMLLNSYDLAWVGVLAFSGAVLFALVTLPVEINASVRGLRLLEQSGVLVASAERQGARRVLSAAALTYVAGLAQAVSTLLYYMFLLGGRPRRRR